MGGLPVALLLLLVCKLSAGTRVSGVTKHSPLPTDDRNNNAPLFYLAKFGVASGQNLYVFGSVKTEDLFLTIRSGLLLVLVPQDVSDSLVAKHGVMSCNAVFESVLNESISVDDHTCPSGMKDYIRRLPCNNQDPLSCNQPNSIRVVPGNDFTFRVKESPKTEFYYLFMLACDRNYSSSCKWSETENSTLWYDISLVNSDPENNTHLNPFVYQFSLELEGVLLMQLLFSVVYLALLSIHLAMHFGLCGKWCKTSAIGFRRMHLLPAIFTVSLVLEFLHVIFELIHYAVFAGDGFGAVWCLFLGEVFNQFSDWLLILVLLLIGKGWMVTDSALRWKKLTFGVWGAYVVFFSVYFIWAVVQNQVFPLSIWTNHTFQSWPGALYLAYRLALLAYILYEMRQIYLVENRPEKLKLYFSLSFMYIIWFCYLPLVVFIIAFINPLYKHRVVTAFLLVFDLLANVGAVVLFAPRWAKLIFQFDSHLNTVQDRGYYKGLKNFYYGSSDSTSSATNVI